MLFTWLSLELMSLTCGLGKASKLSDTGGSSSQGGGGGEAGAASHGRSPIIPEAGPLVFQTGLDISNPCTSSKSVKDYVESIVLPAHQAKFSRRPFSKSLDIFDCGPSDIVNEYAFL